MSGNIFTYSDSIINNSIPLLRAALVSCSEERVEPKHKDFSPFFNQSICLSILTYWGSPHKLWISRFWGQNSGAAESVENSVSRLERMEKRVRCDVW